MRGSAVIILINDMKNIGITHTSASLLKTMFRNERVDKSVILYINIIYRMPRLQKMSHDSRITRSILSEGRNDNDYAH